VKFYTIHQKKALKIWRIIVFELRKSVGRIKSYDQKNKKNAHFLKNPNFSTKKLQIGLSWSKLNGFLIFLEILTIKQGTIICCSDYRKMHTGALWAILPKNNDHF
jgi:hypothetical protein